MTAAQTLPWPSSRSLHAWWRDLSVYQPRQLWFSHLHFHRVEALAAVVRINRLEPFQLALLRMFAVAAARGEELVSLEHLQVDRQFLSQFLHALKEQGLLT